MKVDVLIYFSYVLSLKRSKCDLRLPGIEFQNFTVVVYVFSPGKFTLLLFHS